MASTEDDNEPKDAGNVGGLIGTSPRKHQGNEQMPEDATTAAALAVSLPSSSHNITAMISPPTPFNIDTDSTMLAASAGSDELDHTLNEKGIGQNITPQFNSVHNNSVDALAYINNGDSDTKIAQAESFAMDEAGQTVDQGASTTNQTSQKIDVNVASSQSSLMEPTIGHPIDQSNAVISKAAADESTSSPQLHIDKDPAYERRGSGFLLLAAEAMERSESRENAIRRAAMELATASASASAMRSDADPNSIVTRKVSSSFDHSAKLHEVFEMPSLHADQLSSTSDDIPRCQNQAITWPTESNLLTAPRIVPPRNSSLKSKSSQSSERLPSGRLRPPPQKHVYHDYASVPDPTSNTEPASNSPPRKKTGGVSQPFPEKLMALLDQETSDHPDVISWLPHGRAFLVRKPKVFTSEIMPNYFRQSKLTSFQRQLNLYGFRRITQGSDGGAYYHELFLRGRPSLCSQMTRQKVKGTGHKQPTDVSSEPNFYAMPSVLPLSATTTSRPTQSLEEENLLMNSPGIRAATLLRRLSSIGTPNQFSLDGITAPPLVSGTRETYSFDSFKIDDPIGESTKGEKFEEV